jgi:sulfate adenylyltransferase (ADP) / ATP adenylyltransferase
MMPIAGRLRAGLSLPNKVQASQHFRSLGNLHKKQKTMSSSHQKQRSNATTLAQSSKLWDDIVGTYDRAQAAQVSTITDTSTEIFIDNDIPFILKIAAVLRDKPKGTQPVPSNSNTVESSSKEQLKKKEWRNPFLPPDKNLFVCHLSETHSLVLNKFNIVPHHSLVITRKFIPQEEPLTPADFSATWQVMQAMPGGGGLAYFNRGPVSGASQPHKHMQIVPLPLNSSLKSSDIDISEKDPPFWPAIAEATAGKPTGGAGATSVSGFPFANFVARIDNNIGNNADEAGDILAETHATLVDLAFKAATTKNNDNYLTTPVDVSSFSYNTIATKEFIMVVPRSKEGSGPVSCNAMAFAGSFFVRSKDELQFIKEKGPFEILKDVGVPLS